MYHVEQTDLHSSSKFEANRLKIKEVMDNFVLHFVHLSHVTVLYLVTLGPEMHKIAIHVPLGPKEHIKMVT